jgi:hypothetical protein
MASVSYRGEEWQLTNQRGGQSRVTDRWTDKIKLDLSFGRDKPLREEKKTAPKKIDTLKVYKDNGAKKTRVTFHERGIKREILLLRIVSQVQIRGMFPTREIKCIEYLR